MADTEIPADVDGLALARDADINPHRPLFTGDVIEGVAVPVLSEETIAVALVGHPCAMRIGAQLARLLHVAPVVSYQEPTEAVWRRHFKVMPLGAVGGLRHAAVKLDQVTLVPSVELDASKRVFCASRPAINILRQRLVYQLTRVVVATRHFDDEAAGAHEELDLMEEWSTAAAASGVPADVAAAEFHEWIRDPDGGTTRQEALADPQAVPSVRRAGRDEVRERYGS